MSEETTENVTLTNRLLLIALVVAVGAGAAAWYFHEDLLLAGEELEDAKRDYNKMKVMAPDVMRLLDVESKQARKQFLGRLARNSIDSDRPHPN